MVMNQINYIGLFTDNDDPVWINADHICAVFGRSKDGDSGGSLIRTMGGDIKVKESALEVMGRIKKMGGPPF